MIKVTVQYNDHMTDIHFPCSENTLSSALAEIHAADNTTLELFIKDVVFPEELGHLKDRFVNPDEVNYLAKRMYESVIVGYYTLKKCRSQALRYTAILKERKKDHGKKRWN